MIALVMAALLQAAPDDAEVAAAIDKFKAAFKSTSPSDRASAVSDLGKTPHAKTMALLVPLLTNDLPPVRQSAAKALGKFADQKKTVIQALTHALIGNGGEPRTVAIILLSLGELGDPVAVPTVQKYFFDKEAMVAKMAIHVASLLPAVTSIDPIIDLMRRQEKIVKANSASGAVLAGGDVNGNNKVVAKSDENVLKNAQDLIAACNATLGAITKESLTNSNEWQSWWNAAKPTFKLPQ